MKELLEDYRREGFTLREWLIYGILAPVVVFGVLLFSAFIDTL